jgi:hypothetical protein
MGATSRPKVTAGSDERAAEGADTVCLGDGGGEVAAAPDEDSAVVGSLITRPARRITVRVLKQNKKHPRERYWRGAKVIRDLHMGRLRAMRVATQRTGRLLSQGIPQACQQTTNRKRGGVCKAAY